MIVYLESNFLLEIALDQEQATSALALLALGERRMLDLVIPVFALVEPFSTITHRARERRRLIGDLSRSLADLRRSNSYQSEATLVASAVAGLASIAQREQTSLQSAIQRVLTVARRLDLSRTAFSQAQVYQARYGLSPQDSIVYATIITDLQMKSSSDPTCFITRNSKDFDAPDITAELSLYQCRLFFSFEEGVRYCTP